MIPKLVDKLHFIRMSEINLSIIFLSGTKVGLLENSEGSNWVFILIVVLFYILQLVCDVTS